VRVFNRATIKKYAQEHANVRPRLWAWFHEVERANWKGPDDIKRRYRPADFLTGNRVVFNIQGNEYRVVVMVQYQFHAVYIRFIGTHSEYSKIDALIV
jgi:mRNA interferase HigB